MRFAIHQIYIFFTFRMFYKKFSESRIEFFISSHQSVFLKQFFKTNNILTTMSHGDVGLTLRQATELFGTLKTQLDGGNNNLEAACQTLKQLKLKLLGFPSFLNPNAKSSTKLPEFMLTREVLETAVLLYARKRDLQGFDVHYDMLRPYYSKEDFVGVDAPASERRLVISGLNLLRLLVGNRLPDFHAAFECMPRDEQNSLYIKFPVTLERYLAEGSFNKLLGARSKAPSNEYLPVLELLEQTVRAEVAKCVPSAYTKISKDGAKQLLMLQNANDVSDVASKYQWKNEADNYVFESAVARVETVVPFKKILVEQLVHVKQIQDVI